MVENLRCCLQLWASKKIKIQIFKSYEKNNINYIAAIQYYICKFADNHIAGMSGLSTAEFSSGAAAKFDRTNG